MKDPLGQLRLRFAGLRLVREHRHGQVYAGKEFSGGEVTVVVLHEAAAADPDLRRSFADAVRQHQRTAGAGEPAIHAADLNGSRPWAATRHPAGESLAERLLASMAGPAPAPESSLGGLPPLPDAVLPPAFPAETPAQVFPDPTFAGPLAGQASAEAPVGQAPAHPTPAPPPRPTTTPPHPGRPAPARPAPGASPHRYPATAAGPRPPVRPRPAGTPVAAVVAAVVIGVLLLMICCAGVAGSL